MIQVGIIGGAGYAAGELIRILLQHPDTEIRFIESTSHKGNFITEVHRDLIGETNMVFTDGNYGEVDVLFLCMGHGRSKEFVENTDIPESVSIIDLSQDYRLQFSDNPFVYGLPEINRKYIKKSLKIANPGCFATGIELALVPLAHEHLLNEDIHITAITGSTGSGQTLRPTSHFSWRNNNVSVYKPFRHQHLNEISETIAGLQPLFTRDINFIPVRGNFSRGILVTAYTYCALTVEELEQLYFTYYTDHPFTHVISQSPDIKQVVNTNKCLLYLEKHGDTALIISVTDNLLKGASGQAVQNMNLMFGIHETAGLYMKPVAF